MSIVEKNEPEYASKYDIRYLERRLSDAYNERQKLKKMLNTVLAVLVDKKIIGENTAKAFMESKEMEPISSKLVEYFEAKSKLWIQKAIKKKGALRNALGIKEGETIPESILTRIKNAEVGTKISFKGKKITVTGLLKRRASLALTLIAKSKK